MLKTEHRISDVRYMHIPLTSKASSCNLIQKHIKK